MEPLAHPKCCRLVRNGRAFEQPLTIGDQDCLSILLYDCINAVFEFMNDQDLDVLSCVSQRLNILAMITRQRRKIPAKSLHICRNQRGDIKVLFKIGPNEMDLKRYFKIGQTGIIPCSFFESIRYITDRYILTDLSLESIIIDRPFITHCEMAFNNQPIRVVHITFVEFDNYIRLTEQETFFNFIASLCSTEQYWNGNILQSAFSIRCLFDATVQLGNCRKISAYSDKNQLEHLSENTYDSLSKFEHLNLESIVIQADRLMEIVTERLKLRTEGGLFLNTTESIELGVLQKSVFDNKLFRVGPYHRGRCFIVKARHLNWKAVIYSWCIRGCMFGVSVNFVRNQHGYETCRYFCCPIYRLQLRGNAHCVKLEDFTETVEITLNVQGNIMCPKPFDVRVNIWEVDTFKHDAVSGMRPYEHGQLMIYYAELPEHQRVWQRYVNIYGIAIESFIFDNKVELVMTVEHTCGKDYACVCKDFGSRSKSFYESIGHVNLMNTTMSYCDMCAYALKHGGQRSGMRLGYLRLARRLESVWNKKNIDGSDTLDSRSIPKTR
ncbi:hypothetical protein PRIPAC_86046 [Pristionchus pacificus]|uniref:Uncharacterized protein n=1 Tax=Pristionchus pacificus TaxID=54126 RepID=A0A2A6BTI9_PRIPA|nr:hypothetical protein PRIPAC_86046 [Pristionchus pacificus]|eukprot:PDM69302.1 hypothetical protein PRIPAC_47604 [Pristionchus pacificus]